MKKNVYGNIEDIIVDFALVTPIGLAGWVAPFRLAYCFFAWRSGTPASFDS